MSLGDEFVNLLASIHSNVSFKQTFWSFERTFNSTLMASLFLNDRYKIVNRLQTVGEIVMLITYSW